MALRLSRSCRIWPVAILLVSFGFPSFLLAQNPGKAATPKQTIGTSKPDPQQEASSAVDKFLAGLKLADLPEGKKMMGETQWITGLADYGQNFYARPVYTSAETLFEGMFDTDVAGVRGYKRLMQMVAVSQAHTTLEIRFIAIAYQDKGSGEWKVLSTGTDESTDIDRQVAFFQQHLADTRYESERENYLDYGKWLMEAGEFAAAKNALLRARDAKAFADDDPDGRLGTKYLPVGNAQIDALLKAIKQVADM